MLPLASLLLILTGCTGGPLFTNIQGVSVQRISRDGLKHTELDQTGLRDTSDCLYRTASVGSDDSGMAQRPLLQEPMFIMVRDNSGVRNFELFTDRHLKGNKGKYYVNPCLYDLIQKHSP